MELNEKLINEIKKNSIYRIEENLRMILIHFCIYVIQYLQLA